MGKRKTTEQFIAEAKAVHGSKYDYSKVEYKNNKTKVCIICPIHGGFLQVPKDHLDGIGCKKCGVERRAKARRLNTDIFIHKAKKVHGEEYDYSKVEYIGTDDEVCIIDKKYNKEFWQTPRMHLKGNGSPFRRVLNLEEFIKRAKEIHGNKYDYSKVEYVNTETKVCIICPIHGEFWQKPNNHLRGEGCPKCGCKVYDTNTFISEACKVHGDKYDYSKVKYINNKTKFVSYVQNTVNFGNLQHII